MGNPEVRRDCSAYEGVSVSSFIHNLELNEHLKLIIVIKQISLYFTSIKKTQVLGKHNQSQTHHKQQKYLKTTLCILFMLAHQFPSVKIWSLHTFALIIIINLID